MALVVKDRVRETSTTTGTGTFTLAGAVSGFQTFSSAIGNTNTTYYTIIGGTEWETGLGTVAAGTLARTTVLESSNAGSAVNFSAGTKDVFGTYPASKALYKDASGNAIGLGTVAATTTLTNAVGLPLSTGVTGTLPTANGGTGATTLAAATIATQGYTTTATSAGTTTLTVSSTQLQFFTGTTTHTVVLPVASTLTAGQRFEIHNNSTGSVTVNSSGSNLVSTVLANTTVVCTCILTSGTTAASWDADVQGFTTSLPVANGGTGLATLTANNVILGAGTSTPTFVAPSTSGNVLTSNGTTWTSATPSARSGSSNITLDSTTLNATLTSASNQVQIISANTVGCSVTLPDATTMTKGAGYFVFYNASPYIVAIKDNGGTIREFLYSNSTTGAGVPLLLTDNSTANGIFRLGNPTLIAAATVSLFGSTNANLSGTDFVNVVQVTSTQYIFVSSGTGKVHNYKLGTLNLTTGVWTFGSNVAGAAWTQSPWGSQYYHTGDSNGTDRGIIGIAYGTNAGAVSKGRFEGYGFGIVSGVLYISAQTSFFATSASGNNVAYGFGGLIYTGSNNCFMTWALGQYYDAATTDCRLSGYKVNISGTTVTLVEASSPYAGAASGGTAYYEFLITSPTTAVSDNTSGSSYAKYHSYNTSTNTITTGARTGYTTRTALVDPVNQNIVQNTSGFNLYSKAFFGTTRMIMPENSGAFGTQLTLSNVGTATVSITLVTNGATYNAKPIPQSNYFSVTSKIYPRRIYVNSATNWVIFDTANNQFFRVDPTDSNLSANYGTYSVSSGVYGWWTSSNSQMLLIDSSSLVTSIVYQLVNLADPFIG